MLRQHPGVQTDAYKIDLALLLGQVVNCTDHKTSTKREHKKGQQNKQNIYYRVILTSD